jgi:hypothetical protein
VGVAMKIDKARLEQFIRTKVERETLGDAQIACLLHVGTSTASRWRNEFHIKPADKFKRKFQEKYGPDALESFEMMVKTQGDVAGVAPQLTVVTCPCDTNGGPAILL